MKYLVDTHILLWLNINHKSLSTTVKNIYLEPSNTLYFSKASLWELALKISVKKLSLGEPLKAYIHRHVLNNGIKMLDIYADHIFELENLPYHHRDPFDRMLIAQSMVESIPVLTNDSSFEKYGIEVIS